MADTGKILIIDDDQDIRESFKMVLGNAGYTIFEAEDSETGSKLANEHQPDLILLDVMMEEVDAGFTFAEELGSKFNIILISSIADSAVKVFDADSLPVRDILQKPIKPDVLIDRVQKALA